MTDRGPGGEQPLPTDWRAPDDARELELDLLAYRREQAAAGRRRRLGRLFGRRYGLPGPLLVAALGTVAVFAASLVMFGTAGAPSPPRSAPLAATTTSPGRTGGLLPTATLQIDGGRRPVRAVRPAVLAVAASPCRCADALGTLADKTAQYALPLVLVAPRGDAELAALIQAGHGRAHPAYDVDGGLAAAYPGPGLTAVLVRGDGIVVAVEHDVADANLDGLLTELSR